MQSLIQTKPGTETLEHVIVKPVEPPPPVNIELPKLIKEPILLRAILALKNISVDPFGKGNLIKV